MNERRGQFPSAPAARPTAPRRPRAWQQIGGKWRRWRDRINKLDAVQFGLRSLLLGPQLRHVAGARRPTSAPRDVIVISVVRNGRLWLKSWLAHHRQLGVRHFAVIDNGSDDGTCEALAAEPDVTVLRTAAPYHAYENTMKRYLAERFCAGRWCLCVDMDELFEYPFMDKVPLADLVAYLDGHKFNAVITQMLDMFSDTPLNRLQSRPDDALKQVYRWFDLSGIEKRGYALGEVPGGIRFHRGGIRNQVFGTENGLTKVSLFKMDGALQPFIQWHHVRNGRFADVSCVLLHFPFVSTFYAKVADAVATGRYGYLTSDEYVRYGARLEQSGDLQLRGETSRAYTNPEALIDAGFLYASPEYRRVLAREGQDGR